MIDPTPNKDAVQEARFTLPEEFSAFCKHYDLNSMAKKFLRLQSGEDIFVGYVCVGCGLFVEHREKERQSEQD